MGEWALKWQMKYNISKCKVMHIGAFPPPHSTYMLMGFELTARDQGTDCWVTVVDSLMKTSTQCVANVEKANSMLAVNRIGTENKTATITVLI